MSVSNHEVEPTVLLLLELLGERNIANGQVILNFHDGVFKSVHVTRVHRPERRRSKPLDDDREPGAP